MPATLLLDDELDSLLRMEAQNSGRTAEQVAASLLRAALVRPSPRVSPIAFRIQPHLGVFAPGVNFRKLNQLADDLDTSAFLEHHAQKS
jgi:hypothetical protein